MTSATTIRLLASALAASAFVASCQKITDPPEKPPALILPGLLTLDAPARSVADAATQIRVEAKVDTSLKGDARVVKFTTTGGFFGDKPEVTVRADSAGSAIAILRAPADSLTAIVTAVAGPTSKRTEVTFVTALAERLDLDPSQFAIEAAAGKEVVVTATLRRRTGLPSPGALVTFAASDSNARAIGQFSSAPPSNANGVVATRFSVGVTDYRGAVTITASAPGVNGTVTGTTSIQVVSPR